MVKILFLQFIYGIVDKAMEMELHSNIRFINFLDYPGTISDARTIWLSGIEYPHPAGTRRYRKLYDQIREIGITIKKDTM